MDELTFAERIIVMRKRRGMTQGQLAAVIGVAPSEIHRLETGLTKDPHMSRLIALAQALRVTTDWLCGIATD